MKVVRRSEAKMGKLEFVRVLVLAIGSDPNDPKAPKIRQQYDYVDITEAKPEEVFGFISRALDSASQRK